MITGNKGCAQTSSASLADVGGVVELGEEVVGIGRHFGTVNVELCRLASDCVNRRQVARCVGLGDIVPIAVRVNLTGQGELTELKRVLETT